VVTATRTEIPLIAWRERLVLLYPHGMKAFFDPRGRFVKPGDRLNGYVVDRFEVEGDEVVAILTYH
jgi:hypothetical protein